MTQQARMPSKLILAAGLSPAWQQIMVFDHFQSGEVNRAREVRWCASGKVLNVGIALARLTASEDSDSPNVIEPGVPPPGSHARLRAKTLSVVGPQARVHIEQEFATLGIPCHWIDTIAETRICTTVLDRSTGQTTELVENASPLIAAEVTRFEAAFADHAATADVVVLTGSLPPGTKPTFYRDLLNRTPAQAVLDIRGPELLDALDCRPLCVKPNREELAATVGRSLGSAGDLHLAMRELIRRGARWVVVTQGAGPVWASNGECLYRFQPPVVTDVVNPIASGDCLAAGIARSIALDQPMPDAIRFGIASAVANTRQLLPARINVADVLSLQHEVAVSQETSAS